MKTALLTLAFLMFQTAADMPRNNPNGTWESSSGTRYELKLAGTDLSVKLVPGSNPRFVSYEMTLASSKDEVNTYTGKGVLVAKVGSKDKECKFDMQWLIVVVAPNQIFGSTSNIVPDPDTCAIKERTDPPDPKAAPLDLKKK